MKKNRAKPPGKLLAEFVTNPRSAVYSEICAVSIDENELQSDQVAELLRREIQTVISDLLSGQNFERINENLARYTVKPPEIRVRPVAIRESVHSPDFFSGRKSILLGRHRAYIDSSYEPGATAHQLIYGVLKRALETGDIERLTICRRFACRKLWYRKSTKGEFSPSSCRWKHRNEEAKKNKEKLAADEEQRKEQKRIYRFEEFLKKAGSQSGSKEQLEVGPIVKKVGVR